MLYICLEASELEIHKFLNWEYGFNLITVWNWQAILFLFILCSSSSVTPYMRNRKEKQEKTRNETVARFISIPRHLPQQHTWSAFSSNPFHSNSANNKTHLIAIVTRESSKCFGS
jgi:hypothetical protein